MIYRNRLTLHVKPAVSTSVELKNNNQRNVLIILQKFTENNVNKTLLIKENWKKKFSIIKIQNDIDSQSVLKWNVGGF